MDKNNYTIQEIKRAVDEFSNHDNARGAYEYYKGLKNFIEKTNLKQVDPKIYNSSYEYLVRLKFLSLTFFDDWREIEELLKNHFEAVYKIKYYDLWNKIKINLLTIPDLNRRDKIKDELKKILLNCNRAVIGHNKYKDDKNLPITVAEWLKDYIVNLGIDKIDNLKRVQYLTNSQNIKELDDDDKNRLKFLFNFYENLKISSNTPEGFENDIPMTINRKHVIYTHGQTEEINSKIIDLIKSIKVSNKTADNKEKNIEELRVMADKYPTGSLERKAVEEEIKKMMIE